MSGHVEEFSAVECGFPAPFRLMVRDEAGSTNDEVKNLAASGAAHGLVLLALRQTDGRGRRGAAWFSPEGESLAFSILLRPPESKALWPRLALATGLAVAEAVESFGLSTGIKWPNDLWIGRRKVAGILVEAGEDYAVVGIGLNVNTTEFPPEVEDIATSLRAETRVMFSRAEVLGAVIRRFAIWHSQIGEGFGDLIDSVGSRCVLTGKRVSFLTAAGPGTGTVHGIAPGGELQLLTPTGMINLLQADEIRILD
jgi:BirA family biotin operon repressor/biotin-[acetyl-CoA-carboxylase] ligase